MFRDRFDYILGAALALLLVALAGLFLGGAGADRGPRQTVDRGLERESQARARVAYLDQLYAPVVALQEAGQDQQALLKLQELERSYPGEAHGEMLRAASLYRLGALEEAVSATARGIRLRGDYLDRRSPLSRRPAIEALVKEAVPRLGERARSNPGNSSLASALKEAYYLQSRLAGGCE